MWLTPSSIARAQHRDRVVERRLEQLHGAVADPGYGGCRCGRAAGLCRSWCSHRETLVEMRRSLRLPDCSRNGGASAWWEVRAADARRNRQKLLEVATAAFAAADGDRCRWNRSRATPGSGSARCTAISPAREALVEAVYRTELAEVAAAAEHLLKRHPPKTALRRWMDRYASLRRRQARHGRVAARDVRLRRCARPRNPRQHRRRRRLLLQAGRDDGSLRSDVQADDVVSSLIGIFLASGSPEQTGRLLDLLVAGIGESNAHLWVGNNA